MRTAHVDPPADTGVHDGLAYALFLPRDAPLGGVVIVHGADSTKESHFDFARACRAAGLAAVALDLRGHGDSPGPLDGRLVDDVASVAELLPGRPAAGARLEPRRLPRARGRRAAGRGRRRRHLPGERRAACAGRWPQGASGSPPTATRSTRCWPPATSASPRRGSARGSCSSTPRATRCVPVMLSRALHEAAQGSRLIEVPGGHHRSVQHDPELQAAAVRFLVRAAKAAS